MLTHVPPVDHDAPTKTYVASLLAALNTWAETNPQIEVFYDLDSIFDAALVVAVDTADLGYPRSAFGVLLDDALDVPPEECRSFSEWLNRIAPHNSADLARSFAQLQADVPLLDHNNDVIAPA